MHIIEMSNPTHPLKQSTFPNGDTTKSKRRSSGANTYQYPVKLFCQSLTDAEMCCAALCLNSRGKFFEITAVARPEHFFTPVLRQIMSIAAECYAATDATDAHAYLLRQIAAESMSVRAEYLDVMTFFAPPSNARRYALLVREYAVKRELHTAAKNFPALFDESADFGDMLAWWKETFDSIAPTDITKTATLRREIGEHYNEIQQTADEKRARLIPSHIQAFDNMLDGGTERGDVMIIGARSSAGKTAIAVTMLTEILLGGGAAAFLSLEMEKKQIIRRIVAQLSGVPMSVMKGWNLTEWELRQTTEAHSVLSSWDEDGRIFINDGNMKLTDIRNYAREFARAGISVMFLDYMQLIGRQEAQNKNKTREQEVAEFSRAMKSIALENNIVIVGLAQLNKAADGSNPQMSSIRESESLIQDADYVMLLDRPEQRGEKTTEFQGGNVDTKGMGFFYLRKARNGRTGDFRLRYNREIARFEDLPEDLVL